MSVLFWLMMVVLNAFLLFEVGLEWWEFDRLNNQRLSPVVLCQNLNSYIWIAYMIHSVIVVFAVLGGRWYYLLVNAPYVGWRGYQWMTHNIKLEPIKLRKKEECARRGTVYWLRTKDIDSTDVLHHVLRQCIH